MTENIKATKNAIEWRRDFVLQKLTKGWSQTDIAKELKLHPSTISLDVQYLREKSKEELRTHIQDRLPFEYQRARTGINKILRKTTDILEKTTDPKLQLQYMTLLVELYSKIVNMATDGGIIEQAIKRLDMLKPKDKEEAELMDEVQQQGLDSKDEEDLEETQEEPTEEQE